MTISTRDTSETQKLNERIEALDKTMTDLTTSVEVLEHTLGEFQDMIQDIAQHAFEQMEDED